MKNLQVALSKRKKENSYRRRRIISSPQGIETIIDGKKMLSFCSNDYLGLANHPAIKKSFQQAVNDYGVGGGAAHLINGHSKDHHALEEELADFVGQQRALLFSTGYMANLAITTSLLSRNSFIFSDKLNHASLIDAGRLTDATMKRYAHNDIESLDQLLNKYTCDEQLVMTDAVFSMDGDIANVPELIKSCEKNNAWLILDDAHGFAVLGESGKGTIEHFNLDPKRVPIVMATLGKAMGTFGAFVAGSDDLIETLIQSARTYIYTTATPPALAAATRTSLRLVKKESWRREKLQSLICYFKQQASSAGLHLMASDTAIQPIIVGSNESVLYASDQLFAQGIHVTGIRPPTVPEGTGRLRVTLCAEHEEDHVDRLVGGLASVLD